MIKKWIALVMFFSLTFILTSCDEYVSPIMFQLSTIEDYPSKFPATVDIDYYISNDTKNLYGEDKYITFEWNKSAKISYFTAYPVKKTKDGYSVIGTMYEKYAIPNPEKMGYSEIYNLNKKNGVLTMNFQTEEQLKSFVRPYMSGLDDVCNYHSCK